MGLSMLVDPPPIQQYFSIFFKMGQPRPVFHFIFVLSITKFCKKYVCEKCPYSIWCRDSNSRPLEHESPPITTRPGLPPYLPSLLNGFVVQSTYVGGSIPSSSPTIGDLPNGWSHFRSHFVLKIRAIDNSSINSGTRFLEYKVAQISPK